MAFLDYSRFRQIVDGYFDRFHDAPEVATQPANREYGYIEVSRFFGENAVDPAAIAVRRLAEEFEFSDRKIARFAAEIEAAMRAEGRLSAGPPVMKLAEADLDGDTPSLTVQPCPYGFQAGSCFALDSQDPLFEADGGSLREYYLDQYRSRRTENSPLAICLGVAACVVAGSKRDRTVLVGRRTARLASLESSFGSAVSGSVDFPVAGDSLARLTQNATTAEAAEELQLTPEEYRFVPLGYAREVFRGERPQLFGALMLNLTRNELDTRLSRLDPEVCEFDRFEWLSVGERDFSPGHLLSQLNYEGQMNLELLREYFGFGG